MLTESEFCDQMKAVADNLEKNDDSTKSEQKRDDEQLDQEEIHTQLTFELQNLIRKLLTVVIF